MQPFVKRTASQMTSPIKLKVYDKRKKGAVSRISGRSILIFSQLQRQRPSSPQGNERRQQQQPVPLSVGGDRGGGIVCDVCMATRVVGGRHRERHKEDEERVAVGERARGDDSMETIKEVG